MKETEQLRKLMESVDEGYTAQATTDSSGNRASFMSPDNLRTSGLAGAIAQAADVTIQDDDGDDALLRDLLHSDKFSMLALRIQNDFDLDDSEHVRYGNNSGYRFIKTEDGRGYKERRGKIFKI